MFGGKCAYCGCELPANGWHADHVKPVLYGSKWRKASYDGTRYIPSGFVNDGTVLRPENDTIENMFPACRACNINKSGMPLEMWREFLTEGPVSLASYNGRFRHMLRFGIVTVNPQPFTFWFERYNCEAQDGPRSV